MTRRRQFRLAAGWSIVLGLGACLLCSDLLAKQGVVRTRDGRTLEGDIIEKPTQVVIKIRGIETTLNRDDITTIEYFDSIEQRYEAKRKELPKSPTAPDHLALARWLYDNHAYDLALQEIDAARRIDPNSAAAATLEQTIMAQKRIERTRPAGDNAAPRPPANTEREPGGADTNAAAKRGEAHLLAPEDIALIRKWEWKGTDRNPPRVSVPADVRRRYVALKAYDPGRFASLSPVEQAQTILTDRDAPAEMKREVKVLTDPQLMVDFRRVIQPLVVNNCAATGCHGGPKGAGGFFLYNNNTEREDVAYTNFYHLRSYSLQRKNDKLRYMLDPGYPDESILAQFALHPDAAEFDHPELKGQAYKPIAVNRNAPGYQAIVNWMRGLAMDVSPGDREHPVYWIQMDLPWTRGGAARPPAPQPQGTGEQAPNRQEKAPTGGGTPPAAAGDRGASPRTPPANK